MIYTINDSVKRSLGSWDPAYRFWIVVHGRNMPRRLAEMGIFSEPNEYSNFVREWTDKNCTGKVTMGRFGTLFFELEDDAILFLLTFKK